MQIRPALTGDHEAVTEFTTGTFAWGDYVPERFPTWLDRPDSIVMVAVTEDDQPVGVSRCVQMSDTEAWLHAARVHPDHRRQGIAAAMNEALCQWAADRGVLVARLMTEDWNTPAIGQVQSIGYRSVSDWSWPMRQLGTGRIDPVTNGGRRVPGEEQLASGSRAEIDPAWIAWSSSEMARAGRGLKPSGWMFRKMTIEDVREASRERTLLQCASGWVIAEPTSDGTELLVRWVVTNPLDAPRLARAVIDLAVRREMTSVMVMIPAVTWLEEAFVAAGCSIRRGNVWERALV